MITSSTPDNVSSAESALPAGLALPALFRARMERLLGDEYPAFLSSYEKPLRPALRLNPLRTDSSDGQRFPFPTEPVPWAADGYYYPADPSVRPGKHPFHEAGLYYIQEASAMLPASLCPPCPEERVLDLCAAPGGKATQLAASLEGRGLLVANEIHPTRAAILSRNIERMGIGNAVVTNESPAALAERFPDFFDKIVVDAPCSGEGMFRKEEQSLSMWSQENIDLCAARQDEILCKAAGMLRPGGYLVYSTCTFAPEEDEGTLLRFLRRHPEFEAVEPINPLVKNCLASGLLDRGRPDWVEGGQAYAEAIRHAVRVFPHHADGEGHFAVLLHKSEDAPVNRKSIPGGRESSLTAARTNRNNRSRKTAAPDKNRKLLPTAEAHRFLNAFLEETVGHDLPGTLCLFGEQVYLLPDGCGLDASTMDGLRVLRAGLCVGIVKQGRFEPSHALALFLRPDPPARTFSLDMSAGQAEAYLRGEVIPCPTDLGGWYLCTVGGYTLGWGKAGGGMMKNHYPKGLRRT